MKKLIQNVLHELISVDSFYEELKKVEKSELVLFKEDLFELHMMVWTENKEAGLITFIILSYGHERESKMSLNSFKRLGIALPYLFKDIPIGRMTMRSVMDIMVQIEWLCLCDIWNVSKSAEWLVEMYDLIWDVLGRVSYFIRCKGLLPIELLNVKEMRKELKLSVGSSEGYDSSEEGDNECNKSVVMCQVNEVFVRHVTDTFSTLFYQLEAHTRMEYMDIEKRSMIEVRKWLFSEIKKYNERDIVAFWNKWVEDRVIPDMFKEMKKKEKGRLCMVLNEDVYEKRMTVKTLADILKNRYSDGMHLRLSTDALLYYNELQCSGPLVRCSELKFNAVWGKWVFRSLRGESMTHLYVYILSEGMYKDDKITNVVCGNSSF